MLAFKDKLLLITPFKSDLQLLYFVVVLLLVTSIHILQHYEGPYIRTDSQIFKSFQQLPLRKLWPDFQSASAQWLLIWVPL